MKLKKSTYILAELHQTQFANPEVMSNWANYVAKTVQNYTQSNKTQEEIERRLRWDLWWNFPKHLRDRVISASIPQAEWQGGYPDVSDDQLDTLFRHVWGGFVNQFVQQCI